MSWQDELRRLDVELAEGRISHERHRKLCDELLAGASGGGAPSPVASPLRRSDGHQWQSTNPDLREEPAAVPFTPPEPPKPVRTFVTDRRTTAPSPADLRPTDSLPYSRPTQARVDAATVIRPAVLPPSPPPRSPLSAVVIAASPSGRRIDNPYPHAKGGNRQKPVWLFISLGVLLVAALIIGGTWWLGGHSDSVAPTSPPSESTRSAPEAAIEDRLPALPGLPNPNNSTMSIARGRELGLYQTPAADTFTRNGATEVIFRGSAEGADGYLIMVIPTSGPGKAQAAVEYLYRSAVASGFTRFQSDLPAVTGTDGKTRWSTTWYASGARVVSIGLSQPAIADKFTLASRQDQTIKSMRDVLPPG